MANAFYPKYLESCLDPSMSGGGVDMNTDTIKVALLDGTYTYSTAHEFFSSASGDVVGTPVTLTSPTVTGGVFDADNATVTAVTGAAVAAYVIYKDTGNPSTSRLIAYYDTDGNSDPISVTPNGGDITVTWHASGIFALGAA